MAGLIPFLLNPSVAGTRSSLSNPPNSRAQQPEASATKPAALHHSEQGQDSRPSPVMPQPRARSPATSPVARPRPKRLSQHAPLPVSVLPYTSQDWAKVVGEVKKLYLSRRYRPCSVRCSEVLDNIKNPASVEPTYLIYLNFYAASSLEMSAKALQTSSPYRTKLLQRARDHYTKADELIQAADESMTRMSRPSSAATTSSLHSPAGSNSSRGGWTNSTALSSPTLSIHSIEDIIPAKQHQKKRVTFDLSEEPIIRPDSPTLGFDDFSLYVRPAAEAPLPAPAKAAPAGILRYDSPSRTPEPAEPEQDAAFPEDGDEDPFVVHRSIHRYCGLLSSLRRELTSHLAEVEAQLAAPPPPPLQPSWSGRSTPDSPSGTAGSGAEEMRSLDLQTRIERLRQSGWQRRRFDPQRYERLREAALSELS